MPAVEFGPPLVGTYRYVLARFDWSPRQAYLEQIYGEVKRSRSVTWPDDWGEIPTPPNSLKPADRRRSGERQVCMIFVTSRHFRDRLVKLGWRDYTDEWQMHLERTGTDPIQVNDGELGEQVATIDDPAKAAPRGRHAAAS